MKIFNLKNGWKSLNLNFHYSCLFVDNSESPLFNGFVYVAEYRIDDNWNYKESSHPHPRLVAVLKVKEMINDLAINHYSGYLHEALCHCHNHDDLPHAFLQYDIRQAAVDDARHPREQMDGVQMQNLPSIALVLFHLLFVQHCPVDGHYHEVAHVRHAVKEVVQSLCPVCCTEVGFFQR